MFDQQLQRALLMLSFIVFSCAAFAQSGCTSPTACNFDPVAITDDGSCCSATCVTIDVIPDFFFGIDNSRWEVRNSQGNIVAQGLDGVSELCLTDPCFTFHTFDDFGDGWADGSYTISVNNVEVLAGTFPTGTYAAVTVPSAECPGVFGCTLPFACNFNPAATALDWSCTYPGCTDSSALNYNPNAGCDDGSCTSFSICDGNVATNGGGQTLDFIDDMTPANWLQLSDGNGPIAHDNFNMLLIASNASPASGSLLTFSTMAAPRTGDYSFTWDYHSLDAGAQYEIGYYINGIRIDVTNPTGTLTQAGVVTFSALSGDVIGFGIESTDDIGGPAYFLISDFTSPQACGCIAPSACNYNPAALDGTPDLCNWDCYGCGGDVSCNYVPFSTEGVGNGTIAFVAQELSSVYSWLPNEEITSFIDDNVFLVPCVYGVGSPGTCDCYDSFWPSDAYVQALPGTGYVREIPYVCNGQQSFGMHGGLGTVLDFYYDCSGLPAAFDVFPNFGVTINLYVPDNVPSLHISGFTSDVSNTINVYHSASTTVTGTSGVATINSLPGGITCGCTDNVACNYDPLATQDDFSCLLPDGCDVLSAINYCPGSLCGTNCYYLTPCGISNAISGGGTRLLGFNDSYSSSEWTLDVDGGTGSSLINDEQLTLSGDMSPNPATVWTTLTTATPVSGLLSFDYQYIPLGTAAPVRVEYFNDGVWNTLVSGTGGTVYSGNITMILSSGEPFSIRVGNISGGFINDLTILHFFHPIAAVACLEGCTNPLACNFDPGATGDDDSCEYLTCAGCTYPDADNYDPTALIDDGSCIGPDSACLTDLDGDGFTQTADLLIVLSAFGTACP